MPIDHYVTLGRCGLRVSPLCLGAMTFGEEWGFGSSPTQSKDIIARYLELGGNFIDTANVYTKGHSEKIIGDYFKRSKTRNQAVIATKFFGVMRQGDPNSGGTGRKAVLQACEESLRRLQTDYIDLYWMHCYDRFTPIEETMMALDTLVTQGKVRYIGFSDTPAYKVSQACMLAKFRGWAPLTALQIEYSLLQRTVEGELIPAALDFGLGVCPWSPLKSGILTGKYTSKNAGKVKATRGAWVTSNLNEKAYAVIDVLIKAAKDAKTTPARVALAWVQSRPGVSSTIIGARTMEQLNDNLAALELRLTPAQIKALDAVSAPNLNFPYDFVRSSGSFASGGCTINGETFAANPLAPKNDAERY